MPLKTAHLLSIVSCLLAAATTLNGCGASVGRRGTPRQAAADTSSRAWPFMRNPFARHATISPNGKSIAAITTLGGHEIIMLWDVDSDQRVPLLKFPNPDAQIAWVGWANDERLLFSVDTPLIWSVGVRARSTLLYTIKRDGSGLQHLGRKWFGRDDRGKTSVAGDYLIKVPIQFEDQIVSELPSDPDHILLQLIRPCDKSPGVYRLNVNNGRLKRVVAPQASVYQWMADHDDVVRIGWGQSGLRYWVVARTTEDDNFEKIHRGEVTKGNTFRPLGFTFNPRIIYVASDHEDGPAAVYEYDLVNHAFGRMVVKHPSVDVFCSVSADRIRQVVESIDYLVDRPERFFLDRQSEEEQAAIDRALPGRVNRVTSESLDHRRAVVISGNEDRANSCYVFDREKRTMNELYTELPGLIDRELGSVRAVSYTARDGTSIPAYLTTPAGVAAEKLPTVILPHGGPSSRDAMTFDPAVHFLASLGYAVFQPNYRGSSGYGSAHQAAGAQEWGLAMQDDITDGAEWLAEEGIADRERMAIYGLSYGGYAALMGLIKTPELFRCGASYAGVADLVTMLNDFKWYRFDDANVPMIGSTWSDRERLNATSPYQNVERIKVPVLLGHGDQDSKVHVKHTQMMADALESAGKSVELVIYKDEIHGLRLEKNRIDFYNRLASFLDECMD